ncbi:X-linked retinitis pigmentosa GTPase regulator-like protein [Aphelenchoides besseyi]|nr:X-linked retinitis pigmentosa GTPase regulator-like protein [Aphelenchoides besseyi]
MTTHELQSVFDVEVNGDEVLDYSYISDENFLLLVALTSKGNIITLHRSSQQQQTCSSVALSDICNEYWDPHLITLTPDASLVILILANENIILIPIRKLMNATWGDQNDAKPFEFSIESDVDPSHRLPTSIACFNSVHNSRTYIVYSNSKFVHIIDVEIRRFILSLSTDQPIRQLEVYSAPNSLDLWLILTHTTAQQSLIRIESEDLPLRENMAHTIPSDDIIQVEDFITANNSHNTLTAYSSGKRTLSILSGLIDRNEVSSFSIPHTCRQTYYAPRLLVYVTNEDAKVYASLPFTEIHDSSSPVFNSLSQNQNLFESMECKSKVLGFVPISRADSELDQTLMVSSAGIFLLKPVVSLSSLALTRLNRTKFSKAIFLNICECTKKEPFTLYESIFRDVVKSKAANLSKMVAGLIVLSVEMDFEIGKLSSLVNELNQHDALIPYLSIRCEREKDDSSARQLLFETYMHKLWKLELNSNKKIELEQDIRQFLIKYESDHEIVDVLLKHSLLSCVLVVLQRTANSVSTKVASFLLEKTKWSQFKSVDLLRVINALQWSLLENSTKKQLNQLLMRYAAVDSQRQLYEWAILLQHASREYHSEPTIFGSLFGYTSLAVLNRIPTFSMKATQWQPVGFGSNCTVIIADDRKVWAFGEFKAGNLRPKATNENGIKKSDSRKRLRDDSVNDLMIDTLPLFNLTKQPQELALPSDVNCDPFGFSSVVCGTEHTILLTSSGRVFSYGKNRFGQCGVGHTNPVTRLTEVCGQFARPVAIYAGAYHSGILDENRDVWMFGWAVHGQLATEAISNVVVPTKIDVLSSLNIKSIALGMAHSLFLSQHGVVYGCGFMDNGELLVDPQKLSLCKTKSWRLIEIKFPEPIEILACSYFIGVGVSRTAIYEWGTSPHALKMNAYLQKRQNAKIRAEQKLLDEMRTENTQLVTNGTTVADQSSSSLVSTNLNDPTNTPMRSSMSRDHFKLRRICSWDLDQLPIRHLSVGYNHAAILTTTGNIYTWGRGSDFQLGHGTKFDKSAPTQLIDPSGIVWSHVQCGRNATVAVNDRGCVFCFGRNDRGQLGVPANSTSLSQLSTQKNITLESKTTKKKLPFDLPVSACVNKPTVVAGIHCGVNQEILLQPNLDEQLCRLIDSCDQSTLHEIAKQLRISPICSLTAIRIQFLSGDLLYGADNLVALYAANRPRIQCEMSELRKQSKQTSTEPVEQNHNTMSPFSTHQSIGDDPTNGNVTTTTSSLNEQPTTRNTSVAHVGVEEFERLLDLAWQPLSSHPSDDVRVVSALIFLLGRLPSYGRLSTDERLCRLVAAHIELPQPNSLTSSSTMNRRSTNSSASNSTDLSTSVDYCTSATANRQRMSDLKTARDRAAALRRARVPGPSKLAVLRQRADQQIERFDYFAACGHYEVKRVEGSLSRKVQQYRQRRCSRCIPKIIGAILPPKVPGVLSPR